MSSCQNHALIGYGLLLKSFKEHEFFIGNPFVIEKRVVKLVDDVVGVWDLFYIGEASDTEVTVFC